jgi:hypothetical protein
MESTKVPRNAVKYLVKEKSLIGNEIFEAGAEAMYDGLPAENLEPLCDVGRERYQEYLESNAARVKRMYEEYPPTVAEEVNELVRKALAEQLRGS